MQAAKVLLALCLPLAVAQLKAANWLSFGNDPQRTSWSPQETDINRDNAVTEGHALICISGYVAG